MRPTLDEAIAQWDAEHCCCHGFDEPCGHGHADRHIHRCLPRALDLGGHCPDSGCPGGCWTRVDQ